MPDPLNLVIFGASGDLTKRKLIPAVYALFAHKLIPERFALLGVSRTQWDDGRFRHKVAEDLKTFVPPQQYEERAAAEFLRHLHYQSINTEDVSDYPKVRQRLAALSAEHQTGGNDIFYLSTPPKLYGEIPAFLAEAGLNDESDGWKRLVIEKPFGNDLRSACTLRDLIARFFREDQTYRIDHFLGKETVQNILVFRFANEIFNDLWNYHHVDSVEITSAEHIGVESRGEYYDGSGVIRDMVQNHLLQVLAMVALEPPISLDADSIAYESLKVFKSLRRVPDDQLASRLVLGQYTASTVQGERQPAYREEEGVAHESRTPTFAAIRIDVDNSRWCGVPFYLRVGKRLPTRVTEVVLHFRQTPHPVFSKCFELGGGGRNQLIIRIQPDEGILLKFGMKLPGDGFRLKNVNMDFHYSELSDTYIPEAYERLLLDCMRGDRTLYTHREAVEECWRFIDPYLVHEQHSAPIYGYPAGTWGPKEAEELVARDGRQWRYPCRNLASDGEYCEL